ncbi:MAG: methyltransferase domain-containing protein [Alteromonadaceae bacterium]|nr:methyltransferase domain-containing protein [Alteromonadaceae bacterium]
MKLRPYSHLVCPIDNTPLILKEDSRYVCTHNHSFDIARQKYVNLLPIQDKRSKHPGDSKEMVLARKQFLDTGVYESIAERVNHLVLEEIIKSASADFAIMDAGCGEGYYLDKLKQAALADASDKVLSLLGMDISKPAVHVATQRDRQNIQWVVGTNRNPPVKDASLNLILCMFGYPMFEVFAKALAAEGSVLLVESGEQHLIELRQIIYDEVKPASSPDFSAAYSTGFSVVKELTLTTSTGELSEAQISDLLLMTPHFFKVNQHKRNKVLEAVALSLTVDVRFTLLRKG